MRLLPSGSCSWKSLNLLAVFSVSSPPIEIRASIPERDQRVVDRLQRGRPLGVLEVLGRGNVLARIAPRGADQDALAVAGAAEQLVADGDVVAALDQRMVGSELDQVGVAVQQPVDFDVVSQKRGGGGGDHGVGGGGGSAGKQNSYPADRRFRQRGARKGAFHGGFFGVRLPVIGSWLSVVGLASVSKPLRTAGLPSLPRSEPLAEATNPLILSAGQDTFKFKLRSAMIY